MLGSMKRLGMILSFGLVTTLQVSGAASAQDPFSVEQCERRSANYLDCQCIADREDELREKESDRLYQVNLGRVDSKERSIALTKARLEKETNPSRIRGLENNIASNERELAELKIRPDPASHDPSRLYGIVNSEGTCRSYDKAYANIKEGCLSTTSIQMGDEAPAYCACVAETAATEWVNAENPKSSLRNMRVSARMSCQN